MFFNINNLTSGLALIITNNRLAVGDWLAFDYETNPFLNAEITASNGEETETIEVTVTINDVDDIWAFLGDDSRANYESASDGEWVLIRNSEYNDLANYLINTSKDGASDDHLFNGSSPSSGTSDRTISNDNGENIPNGNFVFAFKYYSWFNNVVSSRVKISGDDASGPFEYLGGILPEHQSGFNHFVLKGVSEGTTTESFLGMYTSGGIGIKGITGTTYKWRNGDVENLDNTASGTLYMYQGLSTSLKQWD